MRTLLSLYIFNVWILALVTCVLVGSALCQAAGVQDSRQSEAMRKCRELEIKAKQTGNTPQDPKARQRAVAEFNRACAKARAQADTQSGTSDEAGRADKALDLIDRGIDLFRGK